MDQPTGAVTLLFTDIEGSTHLWEERPEEMRQALARHDAILRQAIGEHRGVVFKTIGDAFCAVFPTGPDALSASLSAQRCLTWDGTIELPLRVRMALCTGVVEYRDDDYFGQAVNRVARLLDCGYGGQVLLSLETEESVRDNLPDGCTLRDLGQHTLRDLTRPAHVYQLCHPDLPADFPALRTLDYLPTNLPVQVTSFIGREKKIAEVKTLLGRTRLLTVTGSGGCGKTRLSLQVAADLLHAYPDGVWLIDLAPLADPSLVPQLVASALGIREEPGRSLMQTLVSSVRDKRLLLLLDNCEHLLSACAALADGLLRSCSGLTVLATSRAPLGITGEVTFRLPNLSLPDPEQPVTPDVLLACESTRLFADRAAAALTAFAINRTNALHVAHVCRRLDGIPLAIELAAARVRSLPVEQIARRVDDRFHLLTGGSRTALPRHQTLKALIDWSYDLLSEQEKAMLRRLSVFSGGWTLEAAEAVCSGEEIERWEVLDLLSALVDKSLVIYDERIDGGRHRLLETVRQYAHERISETDRGHATRDRHLTYFAALAQAAEEHLSGIGQQEWTAALERDYGNLRVALDWGIDHLPDQALRLAAALGRFWEIRTYIDEGLMWLERAIAKADASDALPLWKCLMAAGSLAHHNGDIARARPSLERAVALGRGMQSGPATARALSLLGFTFLSRGQGDLAACTSLLTESVAIAREADDRPALQEALWLRGVASLATGDYGEARHMLEEAVAIAEELSDRYATAGALVDLAGALLAGEAHAEVSSVLERAFAVLPDVGNRFHLTRALVLQAINAIAGDDLARARAALQEAAAIAAETRNVEAAAYIIEVSAYLTLEEGQPARAARLLGASDGIRVSAGLTRFPVAVTLHDRWVARVHAALGDVADHRCRAEGRTMGWERALADAVHDLSASET